MNLETYENAIINALKAEFSDYDVESFPQDFENYTFSSAVGCLLVKYNKTTFNEQATIYDILQFATTKWTIVAGFRSLQNYKEVHPQLKKIRECLQGLEIGGYKAILDEEKIEAVIDSDIYCSLNLKIKTFTEELDF